MKALIIYNPTAGLTVKSDIKLQTEKKLISAGYEILVLQLNDLFEEEIARVDLSGLALIVAIGGDGTIKVAAREIINRRLNVPLLVVPFGSANVLALSLGIPLVTADALKLLDSGHKKKIDVGVINNRYYFLVGFSLGYLSSIVIGTDKNLKNKFGFLGYFIKFIWNKIKIVRVKFRIDTINKTFWVRGNSLIIFNAFNFYGLQPKKNVSIEDGILNLYITTNKSFWGLVIAALGVLFYERPTKHVFSLDNSNFKITIKKKKFLKTSQIDGDKLLLTGEEINVSVLSKVLEIFVS